MTKFLIIAAVLALISGLLYWRLRPYINMARRMLNVVRGVRRMSVNEASQPIRRHDAASDRLVRCESCGTWTPQSRAIKMRSSSYCSHECLERTATGSERQKKVGSK